MSTYKLVVRRLSDDWKLLLSIFVGITVAAALVAGAPVYLRTLERQGINTAIDRASQIFLNLFVFAPYVPLDRAGIEHNRRPGTLDLFDYARLAAVLSEHKVSSSPMDPT